MRLFLALALVLAAAELAAAQESDSTGFDPSGHFAVYTGDGEPSDLDSLIDAMGEANLVFLGERHDDPIGHALEMMLLEAAHDLYGAERRVVLGLEMFEADVQPVLDEYLAGYVREEDFLKASRPWSNYQSDYRPLVEFARANGIPVAATNAPARYVSLARRRGLAVLDSLTSSWLFLPHELPLTGISHLIRPPASVYEQAFRAEMAEMGAHGDMPGMPSVDDMLVAQNLRDATMAFWIARQMVGHSLVIHVNGSFHSANRRGIPDHLAAIPILVATMRPVQDIGTPPEPSDDDFIILTDEGVIEN